ncbi:MAG: FAD-dependent oxidoreductase [Anaerolineales bacterium]|nr:FAD-dependent oxidoreductase [Anaerolineales bacterium]
MRVLVIGAGIGGLTTAALLLKAGYAVTVLEAQSYPGGCAGTFFYQGFRFDAGATLAGGFGLGGPHARLAEQLGLTWPVSPADPAWSVHLPDGRRITQFADPAAWQAERQRHFAGPAAERFWRTQERLADLAWDVSSRPFPWPPTTSQEWLTLVKAFRPRLLRAGLAPLRTIGSYLPSDDAALRLFVDAQLLISAQATANDANALYAAAALDLPRRGVNHVRGGIGALARTLVDWIRGNDGEVLYRQEASRILLNNGLATTVVTQKGQKFAADWLVANLTPWSLHRLLGNAAPATLSREIDQRPSTWGAFTLYAALKQELVEMLFPPGSALHHQFILDGRKPLGEGNSIFLSVGADDGRAPAGFRTATISTHTAIEPWWQLRHAATKDGYEERRHAYQAHLLTALDKRLPGFRQAVHFCLPGTPVTFAHWTGRSGGMVGGFPQTSLFQARGPNTGIDNLLLVGDSIFPGQSTAGVTLGGFRVADYIRRARFPHNGRVATPTALASSG